MKQLDQRKEARENQIKHEHNSSFLVLKEKTDAKKWLERSFRHAIRPLLGSRVMIKLPSLFNRLWSQSRYQEWSFYELLAIRFQFTYTIQVTDDISFSGAGNQDTYYRSVELISYSYTKGELLLFQQLIFHFLMNLKAGQQKLKQVWMCILG